MRAQSSTRTASNHAARDKLGRPSRLRLQRRARCLWPSPCTRLHHPSSSVYSSLVTTKRVYGREEEEEEEEEDLVLLGDVWLMSRPRCRGALTTTTNRDELEEHAHAPVHKAFGRRCVLGGRSRKMRSRARRREGRRRGGGGGETRRRGHVVTLVRVYLCVCAFWYVPRTSCVLRSSAGRQGTTTDGCCFRTTTTVRAARRRSQQE